MPKPMKSPLGLAIAATGLTTRQFAEKLSLKYHTFLYRIRTGGLSLTDLWKIELYLDKDFGDIFPNPYRRKPQKIVLNLGSVPKKRPKILATTTVEDLRPEGVGEMAKIWENSVNNPGDKKEQEPVRTPAQPPSPQSEDSITNNEPSPSNDDFVVEDVFDGGLPPS